MHVADYEPQLWFLFQEGEELFLDIHCSHNAAGYSILLQLDPEESDAYAREGRAFLDRLAREVQESGPQSALQRRDVTLKFGKACQQAFTDWQATQK
jgi:hypothetical protein